MELYIASVYSISLRSLVVRLTHVSVFVSLPIVRLHFYEQPVSSWILYNYSLLLLVFSLVFLYLRYFVRLEAVNLDAPFLTSFHSSRRAPRVSLRLNSLLSCISLFIYQSTLNRSSLLPFHHRASLYFSRSIPEGHFVHIYPPSLPPHDIREIRRSPILPTS